MALRTSVAIAGSSVAVTLWLSAGTAIAQAPLGGSALGGTVSDQQNRAISEARVRLTDPSKNLTRQAESDSAGSFLFPSVEPGAYSLEVSKPGFTTNRYPGLVLELGQRAVLTVTMSLGETRTVLNVAAAESSIDPTSNSIGTVVDSGRVRDLPLNGRNFLQLGLLAGGAENISAVNDNAAAQVGHPARMIVLPGSMPYSVGYYLNGLPIRGARIGELALNLSIAAIDQFKVKQGFLMPDNGAYPGAVSIVSKSGTNRFHGEAFEFLRNRSLDSRSFFAVAPEDLKRNQFGFALGGPVVRDRLWFHAFYEGLREVAAFSSAAYSPTSEMFRGDFSASAWPVFDPSSYSATTGTRLPFPNNRIPAASLNPVATSLLSYYLPGSSLASVPSNVFGTPRSTLNDDQGGVRLDLSVSERHQAFLQVLKQNSPALNLGLFPLSGIRYENQAFLAMFAHTWTIDPHTVNSLRAGYFRSVAIGGNEARTQGPILKTIGIQNTTDDRGITEINLQGYSAFGRANGDLGDSDDTWHLSEALTRSASNHTWSLGVETSGRRGWHWNANSGAHGRLQFSPVFTAQLVRNSAGQLAPQPNTGNGFADFLLGMPLTGQVSGLPAVEFRSIQISPFFQDTWAVTSRLTLNLGVSWVLETPADPQGEIRNIAHGFDRSTGLVTYAALGEMDPKTLTTDRNNLSPRLGLAWRPRALRGAVVRAGAGLYYLPYPWLVAQFPLILTPPFVNGQPFSNSQTNPLPDYVLGGNVFPAKPPAVLTPGYAAGLPPGTLASGLDPAMRTGYLSQWNLSLQKGLGSNDSVELTYLGSSGHRLLYYTDLSQCRPGAGLLCTQTAKPWPRYDLINWMDSSGNSSWQGMIAKYDHRSAGGLSFRLEYTFSKALTDAWQSSQRPGNQISSCRGCDKGPATFDVRHRAVASAVWGVPLGRGRKFGSAMPRVADVFASNWNLTAIATLSTGQPVFLKSPNQTGGLLNVPVPNRVCDGRSDNLSNNIRNNGFRWFDSSCFPIPPVGYFGNSGRTVLGGPGIHNWDLGLEKSFLLRGESTRLNLRVEAFNVWNHPQFGQPEGDAGAGTNFGRISSTRAPRVIQVALKVYW